MIPKSEFDYATSTLGSEEAPEIPTPEEVLNYAMPEVVDPKFYAYDTRLALAAQSMTAATLTSLFNHEYINLEARDLNYYCAEFAWFLVHVPASSLQNASPIPIERAIHLGENQNYDVVFKALDRVMRDEELWHKFVLTLKYLAENDAIELRARQYDLQLQDIAKELQALQAPTGLMSSTDFSDLQGYIARKQDGMSVSSLWESKFGPLTRAYTLYSAHMTALKTLQANEAKITETRTAYSILENEKYKYLSDSQKRVPRRQLVYSAQAKLVVEYCSRHPEMWLRFVTEKLDSRAREYEAQIEAWQKEKEGEITKYEPLYNELWQAMGDQYLREGGLKESLTQVEDHIQKATDFLENGHKTLTADIEYLNNTPARLEKWLPSHIDAANQSIKGGFEYLWEGKKLVLEGGGQHYTFFVSQISKFMELEAEHLQKRASEFPFKWESTKQALTKFVAMYDMYKKLYDERLAYINSDKFVEITTREFTRILYESRKLQGLPIPGDIQAKYKLTEFGVEDMPLAFMIRVPKAEREAIIEKAKASGFRESNYIAPQSAVSRLTALQQDLNRKVDLLFGAIERRIIEKAGLQIPDYKSFSMEDKLSLFKGCVSYLKEVTPRMPDIDREMKLIRGKMNRGEATEEEATAFVAAQNVVKNYAIASKVVKDLDQEMDAYQKSAEYLTRVENTAQSVVDTLKEQESAQA